MNYAVNSSSMKQIDDYTVEVIHIPAMLLMERAALETVSVMKRYIKKTDRILAVCGAGNNGGDGIAAGRILYLQGYQVAILFIGEEAKATEQNKTQLRIAENLGIPMENKNKLHEYNVIIDAVFGVGLSRPVTGETVELFHEMNKCSLIFSVDIPSGISADSGAVMNVAVRADYTITFGYQKIGLLLYPGAEYAGEITLVDIGFPMEAYKSVKKDTETFYYDKTDLQRVPPRSSYSNKGCYGKVLVIAGSKGMSGAAFLSAKAAYKSGAGLVRILTSHHNRVILQTKLPEALFSSYDEEEKELKDLEELAKIISWASVIIIGPGLGMTPVVKDLLHLVVNEAKAPMIIDADAINLLALMLDQKELFKKEERIDYLANYLKENTIITPHLLELSRLIGTTVNEISNNLIDTANQCSYNNKLIYVIKDARTVTAYDRLRYINVSGNHGMATGGSGDVLTGIIAAMIAQGALPYEAACLAVYIHGLSGDEAAKIRGTFSLMAEDIADSIEKIIK